MPEIDSNTVGTTQPGLNDPELQRLQAIEATANRPISAPSDPAHVKTADTLQPESDDPELQRLQAIENHGKVNNLLKNNTSMFQDLMNFAKFVGHGAVRGSAEAFGMPVDSWNYAADFLKNHPYAENIMLGLPLTSPLVAAQKLAGHTKIPAGGAETFKKAFEAGGAPTSTPEQEKNMTMAAKWGDVFGEFGGANLPFIWAAPEKMVIQGVKKTVPNIVRLAMSKHPVTETFHDLVAGVLGPGLGAVTGEEIAGPEHEDIGKALGAGILGLRYAPIEAAYKASKAGASWMHGLLGLGTGAKTKVSESLIRSAQDLPTAAKNIESVPPLSPGAKIPVDIKSKDEGLLALRRTVMAKDAELSGNYRDMQKATAEALNRDASFSPSGYTDVHSWLAAKQKDFETLVNKRQSQAVEEAERAVETAFQGISPNQIEANTVKNAYATSLRRQLLLARDDAEAVVNAKWNKVDKNLPVNMNAVYDELSTMEAEHKGRPGQSAQRFPTEFADRFYEVDKQGTKTPKFGPVTRLQEAIDLHSEVSQAIREESAKDAPDRVYMAYLTRLSKALQGAKEAMPAAQLEAVKDANNATKTFHQTFSQGPVGQALGHDVPGAPDVFPGDTIRHFLSQGPAGIDNFDKLMRAVAQRTGKTSPLSPTSDMPTLLRKYIRQDFYDHAMANGVFNMNAARQWMRNNSAPLLHFADVRKELEGAIASKGAAVAADVAKKQSLDNLRKNRASLFLQGNPGKLFNGAVIANDKYKATKELLSFTKDDPTGRATEGLGQMAFDHMMANALTFDNSTMDLQRINGFQVNKWHDENKGVIKALDEALPGIAARFKRIADTARYLEGFNVDPKIVQEEGHAAGLMLRDVMARIMGANIFTRFGYKGGSIQTAAIGSQAFKQLAARLTPDKAMELFRNAMVDPALFKALTTEVTEKNIDLQIRILQPYMYSMGIPMVQPVFEEQRRSSSQQAQ